MKRAALLVATLIAVAACSSTPKPVPEPRPTPVTTDGDRDIDDPPPPTARPTTVKGLLSLGSGLDAPAALRKGTVFLWWWSAEREHALQEGRFELQDLVDEFTRLTILGPVDLTAPDASVAYELPVPSGDVVVHAVLDSQRELFATLIWEGGDGNLLGASPTVTVPAEGSADANIELGIIMKASPPPDDCKGPRRTLLTLDAPEVAGSVGNPTRRRVCVIVPASYATKKAKKRRYPVIYDFPGWGGTDADVISAQPWLDAASTPDREAILVAVDTSTKTGSSYLVDSPVTGDWDAYIAKRVVPAVDKKFRTIATRDGRATAGHSTGGFDAVSFGLRHPELIGVVTGSSPDGLDTGYYFFGDNGGSVLGWILPLLRAEDASGGPGFFASWAADWSPDATNPRGYAWPIDPATGREVPEVANQWRAAGPSSWLADPARVAELKQDFSGRIFLSVGDADEAGLTAPTQRFSDQLTKAGIDNSIVILPGGHLIVEGLHGACLKFAVEHLAPPSK